VEKKKVLVFRVHDKRKTWTRKRLEGGVLEGAEKFFSTDCRKKGREQIMNSCLKGKTFEVNN